MDEKNETKQIVAALDTLANTSKDEFEKWWAQLEAPIKKSINLQGCYWPEHAALHAWDYQEKRYADYKELLEVLYELIDDTPCHHDHHGACQAHGVIEGPCPHERAKKLLEKKDNK